MKGANFDTEYAKLNPEQKEAVETIEGPVMVIAGPGTGKTQVLALRIGNILQQTDTPADGVLCLTFTNSGVDAMKKRLRSYGIDASRVVVSTFHAFGTRLIEEFYQYLDLPEPPATLDEADAVGLVDDLLNSHEWKHLSPRGDASRYFRDLKSLVSLLIRERMSPEEFEAEINRDIEHMREDPENISSRGPTKGEVKKEARNKIESLERTREVAEFYRLYEEAKKARNLYDYDDILRSLVRLATEFEDVKAALRERHLYVLVDEHQDSSGVQNEFLKQVWGPVEKPNVFVVGDDRQLIYGFSGASLSLFEEFRATFRGTKLITLTENYRSTQRILDAADALLESTLAKGKLVSNKKDDHPIALVECAYPRDEIMRAGIFFQERMAEGVPAEECALLVPKNSQVRSALQVLTDMGLEVSAPGSERLFSSSEFPAFFTLLKIINNPFAAPEIAELALDPISGIVPLEAHRFIHMTYLKNLSAEALAEAGFDIGKKILEAVAWAKGKSAYEVLQYAGKVFLLDTASTHDELVKRVEVVRSLLHLSLALEEKMRGKKGVAALPDFISYIDRLMEYGEDVPLASFGEGKGIRVMTLHRSKGLEFDAVWIAHMSERALMSGKRMGLSLPEKLKALEEKKDIAAARREVYVALTRAKRYAALSYPLLSHSGGDEVLAAVLEDMPQDHFTLEMKEVSEARILEAGLAQTVTAQPAARSLSVEDEVREFVSDSFRKKKVSTTALNSFYECPWQWYFRTFLQMPEPEAEALVFGSLVHAAIEIMLKEKCSPEDAVTQAMESKVIESRRMKTDALRALKRFAETVVPNLYDEYESEKPLSYKDARFPELSITGKIDLMEHGGGGSVRVTDFKTGRPRKASEIEKVDEEGRMSPYLRQLAMYSYLLSGASKEQYEAEHSRLYFVESDDAKSVLYETTIGRGEIDLLIQDIAEYEKLLTSGEWMKRPCNHKSYPEEPECPYCALKERLFE